MHMSRKNLMSVIGAQVNAIKPALLATAIIGTMSVAPSAMAGSSVLVERTVTAKFSMADVQTDAGVEKVYAGFWTTAVKSCRADRHSLEHFRQTVSECAADLVDQFVASADIAPLTDFHKMKSDTVTTSEI